MVDGKIEWEVQVNCMNPCKYDKAERFADKQSAWNYYLDALPSLRPNRRIVLIEKRTWPRYHSRILYTFMNHEREM